VIFDPREGRVNAPPGLARQKPLSILARRGVGRSVLVWGGIEQLRSSAELDEALRIILSAKPSMFPAFRRRVWGAAHFVSKDGCNGSGPEFGAGIKCAIEKGWLELHESGTYVRLLTLGEDLLAKA
jgi:hypothetical protein